MAGHTRSPWPGGVAPVKSPWARQLPHMVQVHFCELPKKAGPWRQKADWWLLIGEQFLFQRWEVENEHRSEDTKSALCPRGVGERLGCVGDTSKAHGGPCAGRLCGPSSAHIPGAAWLLTLALLRPPSVLFPPTSGPLGFAERGVAEFKSSPFTGIGVEFAHGQPSPLSLTACVHPRSVGRCSQQVFLARAAGPSGEQHPACLTEVDVVSQGRGSDRSVC